MPRIGIIQHFMLESENRYLAAMRSSSEKQKKRIFLVFLPAQMTNLYCELKYERKTRPCEYQLLYIDDAITANATFN